MRTPEEKSGYWSVNYLNKLANGDVPLSETALRQCAEYIEAAYQAADILESRLAQVERERDAAVQIVHGLCLHCKNEDSEGETCRECLYYPYRYVYGTGEKYVDNWQWRGVCEENTKEEGK